MRWCHLTKVFRRCLQLSWYKILYITWRWWELGNQTKLLHHVQDVIFDYALLNKLAKDMINVFHAEDAIFLQFLPVLGLYRILRKNIRMTFSRTVQYNTQWNTNFLNPLNFANLPITWSKSRLPLLSPNFSNYSIFQTDFHFTWRFKKIGIHYLATLTIHEGAEIFLTNNYGILASTEATSNSQGIVKNSCYKNTSIETYIHFKCLTDDLSFRRHS